MELQAVMEKRRSTRRVGATRRKTSQIQRI